MDLNAVGGWTQLTRHYASLPVACDGKNEHFARHVVAKLDFQLGEEQIVLYAVLLQIDSATENITINELHGTGAAQSM
jgi:hypothetical protein